QSMPRKLCGCFTTSMPVDVIAGALSCAGPSRESATHRSGRAQQFCADLAASKLERGPGVSPGAGGLRTGAEESELRGHLCFFTLPPRRCEKGVASACCFFRGGVGTAANCRVLRGPTGEQR